MIMLNSLAKKKLTVVPCAGQLHIAVHKKLLENNSTPERMTCMLHPVARLADALHASDDVVGGGLAPPR